MAVTDIYDRDSTLEGMARDAKRDLYPLDHDLVDYRSFTGWTLLCRDCPAEYTLQTTHPFGWVGPRTRCPKADTRGTLLEGLERRIS